MNKILDSIKSRLLPLDYEVYLIDVKEGVAPSYPYVLIWSSLGNVQSADLSGQQSFLDEPIAIDVVGLSPESCLRAGPLVRERLMGWTPVAEGWEIQELRFSHASPIQPDRKITLPNANRHPYYSSDVFDLVAERIPIPEITSP